MFEQGAGPQPRQHFLLIELATVEIVWSLPLQTSAHRRCHCVGHIQIGLRGEVVLEPNPSFMLIQSEHGNDMTKN